MLEIFHQISDLIGNILTSVSGNYWLFVFLVFLVCVGEAIFILGLLVPSLPVPAARHATDTVEYPDGTTETMDAAHFRNAFPADHTGYPALSLPCGFTRDGLPIGLQVIGRPFDEAMVLRVGRYYERLSGLENQIAPLTR